MRDIKFRAWEYAHEFTNRPGWKDSPMIWKMDYEPEIWGSETSSEGDRVNLNKALANGGEADYETQHPSIFMQFTGLKDKNGVEIYDGDIVECVEKKMFNKNRNHLKFVSPVFWDDLSWTVSESKTCDTSLAVYDNSNPTKLPVTTIKVIGNIYENPNLLTQVSKR